MRDKFDIFEPFVREESREKGLTCATKEIYKSDFVLQMRKSHKSGPMCIWPYN